LRLAAVGGATLAAATLAGWDSLAQLVVKEIHQLQPGEFTWHPERSPEGPVAVVVSIPDQRVHVYRNGIRIAVSTCSTGKAGHATPTGVFTVLEKDRNHHSSTYGGAPMPNMNRLTWDGIALHAGDLPGYPASHGCVRLPRAFSARLFTVTHVGTPVIIAGGHSDPREVVHPGLVLSEYAEDEFEHATASLEGKSLPSAAEGNAAIAPTSVLVSRADKRVIILEGGRIVAEGAVFIDSPEIPLGSHVFILVNTHDASQGLLWHAIGHHPQAASGFAVPETAVLKRLKADATALAAMKARMHPGMLLVMTDLPTHPDTRSGSDFVIMAEDQA
jgi:Uncharacterized protein conserved in bacteria